MKFNTLAVLSLGALMVCGASTAFAQKVQRSPYLIELRGAPVAAYEGGLAGLAATRPAAGSKLDMASARVQAYRAYLDAKTSSVAAKVPAARITYRFGVVVHGFSAMLTPDELRQLRADPAVKSISADEPMQLDSSYTTSQFLGLGKPGGVWSRQDALGRDLKGEDVIIGIVDSGVWPENVTVSDRVGPDGKPVPYYDTTGTVVYNPLPAGRFRGTCQAGEAFTAAMCNNKLVGAEAFQTTFLAENPTNVWPGEYLSPRDEDGHGTHTMTTAGGNANSRVTVSGVDFEATGVAPRARLAAYKVCNALTQPNGTRRNTCYLSDTTAAIEKATADGVDVINYSIGGSPTAVTGFVENAMLGAAKAGVFVAASAGNSGPGNTVAHISPWVTTVGNSTHDRYSEAVVTLGNGATAQGGSWQTAGVPSAPLILARDAGVTAYADLKTRADELALQRCYNAADRATDGATAAAAIDPAKVAGKILVCIRGGNVFVNKAQVARDAGAVGVIFQNVTAAFPAAGGPSAQSVFALALVLPAVHLPSSAEAAVLNYAATAGATASFAGSVPVAGVVAPIMAGTSSRGPNQGDANILKPDITAPGTDIIASYTAANVTAAERAALIAGTAVGGQGAALLSGTSMSSPHVAGAAALLKQANPSWSQAAIKSALMTSAVQTVKLASGAADTNRWGFGSGHLEPQGAVSTSLVFDITPSEYDAYAAGFLNGRELNLPSITFGNVLGAATTVRTLSNRGSSAVTLNAAASLPGFDVMVTPSTLTIPAGGSANFSVRVVKQAATPFNSYRFGDVVWTGGVQSVRNPLTARASSLVAVNNISDTRAIGSRIFTIGTGFSGPMVLTPSGMVPATIIPVSVAQDGETCVNMVVPAGAFAIRAQIFGGETTAPDLDLVLYNPAGTVVATGFTGSSDELVGLNAPAAGTYQACVQGYDTGASPTAAVPLNTWIIAAPAGTQSLRAAGPRAAVLGGTASVVVAWSTAPGTRSFGVVRYSQTAGGPTLGASAVFVDAMPASTSAVVLAPVERSKQLR